MKKYDPPSEEIESLKVLTIDAFMCGDDDTYALASCVLKTQLRPSGPPHMCVICGDPFRSKGRRPFTCSPVCKQARNRQKWNTQNRQRRNAAATVTGEPVSLPFPATRRRSDLRSVKPRKPSSV